MEEQITGSFTVKSGLAQMAKGGLVMDVVNVEQARIAEEAGVRQFIKIKVSFTINSKIVKRCFVNDVNVAKILEIR